MRKILITNDDGISSEGIVRLAKTAVKFGEVYVVAPNHQCSAMSHHITLHEPFDCYPAEFPVQGVKAYSITGTPADCIRFGALNICKKPDIVISGVNFGFNCGSDLQYSGTVSAALEGACVGIHSIAVSEGIDGNNEVIDKYLEEILAELIEKPLGYNQIWNVNFPDCPLSEFKGVQWDRTVARSAFFTDGYLEEELPNGGHRVTVDGAWAPDAPEGTDVYSCTHGYISIGVVNNIS